MNNDPLGETLRVAPFTSVAARGAECSPFAELTPPPSSAPHPPPTLSPSLPSPPSPFSALEITTPRRAAARGGGGCGGAAEGGGEGDPRISPSARPPPPPAAGCASRGPRTEAPPPPPQQQRRTRAAGSPIPGPGRTPPGAPGRREAGRTEVPGRAGSVTGAATPAPGARAPLGAPGRCPPAPGAEISAAVKRPARPPSPLQIVPLGGGEDGAAAKAGFRAAACPPPHTPPWSWGAWSRRGGARPEVQRTTRALRPLAAPVLIHHLEPPGDSGRRWRPLGPEPRGAGGEEPRPSPAPR